MIKGDDDDDDGDDDDEFEFEFLLSIAFLSAGTGKQFKTAKKKRKCRK